MILPIDNTFQNNKPAKNPMFQCGQLVRHVRYGYRGVIVDFDSQCMADEKWYQSNHTQPDRNQPWYHVLVHQSQQVTYPAESSLAIDNSHEPITHPLIDYFFSSFIDGHYVRNERAWPK